MEGDAPTPNPRGFAALSRERRQQIARLGGRAAQAQGTGHRFTSEEARAAANKGGDTISRDRAFMATIEKKGGSTPKRPRRGKAVAD